MHLIPLRGPRGAFFINISFQMALSQLTFTEILLNASKDSVNSKNSIVYNIYIL